MSYNDETTEEVGFKLDDGIDEDEPMEPLESTDEDFKFDEEPEEDPENSYH